MTARLHRRRFLQTSSATLGYWFLAPALSASRAAASPNGTIHFAGIGIGGKGSSDIDNACELGQVVGLCDIDENNLNAKAAKFTSAKKYFDYRKMLDEIGKQIDAVTVSTPDHTHAPAALMAMRMRKHVYCQKPLTHTVKEARLMRETAKSMNVATQMGNQGTALNGLRRTVEIVQSGVIGPVTDVHVWTNRPVWPQAPTVMARPPEAKVPPYVHWEEFIAAAPMRPNAVYEVTNRKTGEKELKSYYHPFNWRGWWDFGTGALGDMACHTANLAFMALKLGAPTSVQAEIVEGLNSETYPAGARVVFKFPARRDMPAVSLTWYEGKFGGKKLVPPPELTKRAVALDAQRKTLVDSGLIMVGAKAMIYSPSDYGAEVYFDPPEQFRDVNTKLPERLPKVPIILDCDQAMKNEWADAIKGGSPPLSNFDYAGQFAETILLGNIAMRFPNRLLNWNAATMKFDHTEANGFVDKEYRAGWGI